MPFMHFLLSYFQMLYELYHSKSSFCYHVPFRFTSSLSFLFDPILWTSFLLPSLLDFLFLSIEWTFCCKENCFFKEYLRPKIENIYKTVSTSIQTPNVPRHLFLLLHICHCPRCNAPMNNVWYGWKRVW